MALTDTDVYQPSPSLSTYTPPSQGNYDTDAVFGEKIYRISDASAQSETGITCEYNTQDHFNCNGTRLRLQITTGGAVHFYSVSGTTFTHARKINNPGAVTISDYWWSKDDPDILYFVKFGTTALWQYDYGTDNTSEVRDFASDGYSDVTALGENGLTYDGDRIALCGDSERYIFVYEFSSDSVICEWDKTTDDPGPAMTQAINRLRISPLGNYVEFLESITGHQHFLKVDKGAGTLTDWYSPTHATHRAGHGTVALVGSTEYGVYIDSQYGNNVWKVDIAAKSTAVIRTGDLPFDSSLGTHPTALSAHNDGYVYVGTYNGLAAGNPQTYTDTYQCELVRFKIDGSGDVERLAHLRNSNLAYIKYPRGSISSDGRWYIFASDMQDTTTNYVDTYAVQIQNFLPDGSYRLVTG